jgi:hypothetical protein
MKIQIDDNTMIVLIILIVAIAIMLIQIFG